MHRRSVPVLLLTMAWAAARAQDDGAALPTLAERALAIEVVCAAPDGWNRVDTATLDQMRGGFTTPEGLAISLGIERMVSLNGEVVSRTNFQIANMGNISADEARQARDALGAVQLVQNGPNNFAAGAALAAGGTFVQNTLNGQTIQSQTIINSSVNSMSLLKDLNFQGGLRDALIRAIGVH
jgi:hypothetical protein